LNKEKRSQGGLTPNACKPSSTRKECFVTSSPQLRDTTVAVVYPTTQIVQLELTFGVTCSSLVQAYGRRKAFHHDACIKSKGVALELQEAGRKPGPGGVGSALLGVGLHGLLLAFPTT